MTLPDPNFEARQDAELRAVPLPERLVQRLRQAALSDDEGLDEALRLVSAPAGLTDRLRWCVLADDDGLDAALRDVRVPVGVLDRARSTPKNRIRLARIWHWATALSLLLVVGLSYAGTLIAFLAAIYPGAEIHRPRLASAWTLDLTDEPRIVDPLTIAPSDSSPRDDLAADLPMPSIGLPEDDEPLGTPLPAVMQLSATADPFLEPYLFSRDLLGTHGTIDKLPDLGKVAGLVPRGIDPPLVPGFPLDFWIKFGINPFVSPAAHPRLRSSVVPLGIDASSYELTRRYLQFGELPPADVVRTEEFLAAMDYEFPRPKRSAVELVTACGPSPFGGEGGLLLQVGVQARDFNDEKRSPVHLILAVDVSGSMRWEGRLAMIRRAMGEFVSRLGPEDRISLVSFDEEAELLVEDVGRDEADQLLAALDSLGAKNSTNVAAGLRRAYAVAQHWSLGNRPIPRVVLLTDGLAELDRGSADRIEQRLAAAASEGIRLETVDLGHEKEPDRQLASFARAGGGLAQRAASADQIGWALMTIVLGRSQLVAEDVRLEVTFNPQTVVEYRLLGHEAKAMAGLLPAHPEADFREGESATALYEIHLKPGKSGGSDVAVAQLTWRESGGKSAEPRKQDRKVRREDFTNSFVQSPVSLQEAALVAAAAEILRRSPFVALPQGSRSATLGQVLELAKQADSRLAERATFREFLSLIERAQKAR